jgi:hypothetical protein
LYFFLFYQPALDGDVLQFFLCLVKGVAIVLRASLVLPTFVKATEPVEALDRPRPGPRSVVGRVLLLQAADHAVESGNENGVEKRRLENGWILVRRSKKIKKKY